MPRRTQRQGGVRARILAGGLVIAAASGGAHADLYIWKDPATGAMKIYSYPPPWYGNPELEKCAPKVERIPERQRAPAVVEPESRATPPAAAPVPPTAPPPAPPTVQSMNIAQMEARRTQLLQQIVVAGAKGVGQPAPEMDRVVDEYLRLLLDMARTDPGGAEARRAETQAVIDKIKGKPTR